MGKRCKKCRNTQIFHERKRNWICGMCGEPIELLESEKIPEFQEINKFINNLK